MQLIRITNIPAELKMDVENARLVAHNGPKMTADIKQSAPKLRIDTENVKVRLDTTEMRASLNLKSPTRFSADNAEKGKQAASRLTEKYSSQGFQMSQQQKGGDIKDILGATFFPDPAPTLVTKFLPSAPTQIDWTPPQVDMSYQPSEVKISWNDIKQSMEYIPGKVNLTLTQRPRVEIEYLGGVQYVPKSADPNYEEPKD